MADSLFRSNLRDAQPLIVRGEGAYVFDANGGRIFDASSGGVMVANIGHAVSEVAEAMARQAGTLAYAFHGRVDNPAALALAERVTAAAPPGLDSIFFVSTGSEATETAVKLARLFHLANGSPDRHKVIGRRQSYHGSGLGSLALSGGAGVRAGYEPYLFETVRVPPAWCYRCPWGKSHPGCDIDCAGAIEAAIHEAGAETVACVIAEPVVGRSLGAAPAPPEYFRRLREICDRHGVLLIVDEVVTGFGRLGTHFGIELWGIAPDLMAVGKGISGGYAPLAGVLIHSRIADALRDGPGHGPLGYTFSGHPVACAAGLAVHDYMQRHELIERAGVLGEHLQRECGSLLNHPLVGDVRGQGLLAGIELVADRSTRHTFAREQRVAERVAALAFERGVWLLAGSGGQTDGSGDYLVLGPPLVASEDDLRIAVDVVAGALDAVRASLDG